MKSKMLLLLSFLTVVPMTLSAGDLGNIIGGDPSKSWEEGSHDYVVMFNTLLKDTESVGSVENNNPQGDRCIENSSFDLSSEHIPADAEVENVYLIWTGVVDPALLKSPTDNTADFDFVSEDGKVKIEKREVKGAGPYTLDSTEQGFAFEGFTLTNEEGVDSYGYFTYRVDVTDLFKEIQKKGRDAGAEFDGKAIMGKYTIGGIECTEDDIYRLDTGMVSAWSIVLVYKSESVKPKKIFFYNGMSYYAKTSSVLSNQIIQVKGFTFPLAPTVRTTLMVAEGDPGLASPFGNTPPEALRMRGDSLEEWVQLSNTCNPQRDKTPDFIPFNYTEIYNSISSFYGWESEEEKCIGSQEAPIYGIDVDTFVLKAEDPAFQNHLFLGNDMLEFDISANGDVVVTNFLMVSVDTKAPTFDIPGIREKSSCSCSTIKDKVCAGQDFYYVIRIENWGENTAKNVIFKDPLPETVKYVPGTAQIAKEFKEDGTPKWTTISDGAGGTYPFTEGYKVADEMTPCVPKCTDRAILRFRVSTDAAISKNETIPNTASILSMDGEYRSNLGVPLRLKIDPACPSTCTIPDSNSEACGGGAGIVVPDNTNDSDSDVVSSDTTNTTDDSDVKNDSSVQTDADVEITPSEDSSACGCSII